MAGLKKPSRRQSGDSPNLALIIFLVFFILVSIGLGVWGYYGYAGQEKLIAEAKAAATKETAANNGRKYGMMVGLEAMQQLGQPIDADNMIVLNGERDEFAKEGGKYDKESTRELVKKMIEEGKKSLGYRDAERKYDKTYPEEFARLSKELTAKDADIARLQGELKAAQEKYRDIQANQDKANQTVLGAINQGNLEALKAARQKSDEFVKVVEQNTKTSKQMAELIQQHEAKALDYERKIRDREQRILEMENKRTELVSPTRNPTEMHALLLDISRGKPLWDRPVGKLIRVDMSQRQVVVNLGAASGVQPEQSFSVFGVGPYGGAEKHLKATIEITRVLDANTALAKITSLYDASGQEIVLNDQGLLRLQRESDAALRDGDLLFNMFWGTSVAVAGPCSLSQVPTENPAEQMRRLGEFGQFLERQGMRVDAYLNLASPGIEGKITWKTRYLILAGDVPADAKDDVQSERAKNLNELMKEMRKEAVEKGLFVISPDNFLNVAGYRPARLARSDEYTGFRPGPVRAGLALPGLPGIPRPADRQAPEAGAVPAPDAPPGEEKKAPEKEEK
jgi:hypothetical protein